MNALSFFTALTLLLAALSLLAAALLLTRALRGRDAPPAAENGETARSRAMDEGFDNLMRFSVSHGERG